MKNVVNIERVLEYIDVPQLVLARDKFDTQYLCLLYDDEPTPRYTAVRISSERYAAFCNRDVDLRTIFTEPEFQGEYFDIHSEDGVEILEPIECISEERLPEEGYFLDDDDNENLTIRVPKHEKNLFLKLIRRHGWVAM